MTSRRIALFVPSLWGGGAERVMVNLARGFTERGRDVDLVLVRAVGPYLADVPPAVRIVPLGTPSVLTSVPALVRYVRRERPSALLSTLNTANVVAAVTRRVAGDSTRVVVRQSNTLAETVRDAKRLWPRVLPSIVRLTYGFADTIVAVSQGVADDLVRTARLPADRIRIVPNPVVTPEVLAAAGTGPSHGWFAPGQPPVVLGAGRLISQKDFPTLLRAFAKVRDRRDARLVILGEGPERATLERLAVELGLNGSVELPGFVSPPFSYMARAGVFVLSSTFEGLPGALIQAMACGAPVVSTDCPSGPKEILAAGSHGPLVPIGDVDAMAAAIESQLEQPRPAPPEAWHRYRLDEAVDQYLLLLDKRVP